MEWNYLNSYGFDRSLHTNPRHRPFTDSFLPEDWYRCCICDWTTVSYILKHLLLVQAIYRDMLTWNHGMGTGQLLQVLSRFTTNGCPVWELQETGPLR